MTNQVRSWASVSLRGVVDPHVHTSPDVRPRWHTAMELGELADAADMAGFVLKNHDQPTMELAREVRARFVNLEVFGGLVLNRSAGGIDPNAVQRALLDGARVIWLPTKDGLGETRSKGLPDVLPVTMRDGSVTQPLGRILEQIAREDAVLATGHIHAAEVMPVIETARQLGVRRILVNHPEIPFLSFPVDLQIQIREAGAFLERCFPRPEAKDGFLVMAREMREVGVESSILATDLGRTDLPPPLDGFRIIIKAMMDFGYSATEIKQIAEINGKNLIGFGRF